MGINEQISQLKKIEDEYKEKRIQVMEAIEQSIKNIGQNPAITPLGKNTFTIPMSELFQSPWSPSFHNWEVQAQLLIELLHKRKAETWIEFIREIAHRRNSVVGFTGVTVDKIQLNQKFLQKVCELL